tara:strand:+ start:970 stop:1410 length:441 start_codon:yes stop_codon:yes gene_type:complete
MSYDENNKGLFGKYNIRKVDQKSGCYRDSDGSEIYFVLKLNSNDPAHAEACKKAVMRYAKCIEKTYPQLADDLRKQVQILDKYPWIKKDADVIYKGKHHKVIRVQFNGKIQLKADNGNTSIYAEPENVFPAVWTVNLGAMQEKDAE